jgi:hypothetical protein
MKSHVFLTPASKDKAGELVEVIDTEAPQMYAEPVPYFTSNDRLDVAKLRTKVSAAEADLRHAESRRAPPLEIQRLEQTLASLKAELDQAESPRRQQRQRETSDGVTPARQSAQGGKKPWDVFLRDLDAKLAAHVPAMVTPTQTAKNALVLNWDTFLRDPSLRPA